MYKKTVKYTDFDGIERTENFYFNLTEAELVDLDFGTSGGMKERLQNIIDSKDQPALIKAFKDIVLMAYGEKSDDGKYFRKSQEIRDRFTSTQAYSDIYMELVGNDMEAATFINSIVPKKVAPGIKAIMAPNT